MMSDNGYVMSVHADCANLGFISDTPPHLVLTNIYYEIF